MKKSIITMLLILVALCFVYSASDTEAAPSKVREASYVSAKSPNKAVIDIEETEDDSEREDADEADEEDETEEDNETKKTSNDVDLSTDDDDEDEETSSKGNKLFKKSGREAIEDSMKGNDIGIMSDDYELGDETLPEVDEEGFFQHVYNKMWIATTGLQKIVCVIAIMFFLGSLVMVLISALGDRRHLGWYLFSLLISCLVFVGSLYAPQIVAAFSDWFVN